MTQLFGPPRLRDFTGQVYEYEQEGYTTSALHGDLILCRYRKPGQETWEAGAFRVDQTEILEGLGAGSIQSRIACSPPGTETYEEAA